MKARTTQFTLSTVILILLVLFSPHQLLAQVNLGFEFCADPSSFSVDTPSAIALDSEENLYVANAAQNTLLIYDSNGFLLNTLYGLAKPISVAVGDDGLIFVGNANRDKKNVEVYDANLDFQFKLGIGDGEFWQPAAIAISPAGKIYVVDRKKDQVKVYLPNGSFDYSFGQSGSDDGQFNSPTSIAIKDNLVLVTDLQVITEEDGTIHQGARIQTFTLEGGFISSYAPYGQGNGLLTKPMGIAVDSDNITYVADAFENVVQAFDSEGTFMATAYNMAQPMRTPIDVAVGPITERLYVASRNSNRVDVYCPILTTVETTTYNITASATGTGGWISSGSTTVNADENALFTLAEAENITFSITADDTNGYHIDKLIIDGIDLLDSDQTTISETNSQQQPITAEYTFTNIIADHTIEAVYTLNTYTLDITSTSTPANCGQITPTGPVTINHGDNQTFTIDYNSEECSYSDLLIDGVSVGQQESYTFSSVTADHTLEAVFEEISYQITASVSNDTHGMITPAGTITAALGSDHTFYCYAKYGYIFDRMVIDGTTDVSQNVYTLSNVTADHTVNCEFREAVFTITSSVAAGSQGCTISPAGQTAVMQWYNQGYVISVDEGYCVNDLLVDDASVGTDLSYTFYYVNADHSVEVSCSPCFTNTAPVAEAGPDQNAGCQAEVTFVGENSYDNDLNDTLTYQWEQISGTEVTLSDETAANPTFTTPDCAPGDESEALRFQLTVSDTSGATGTDECIVNVSWQNITPQANAGSDQNVNENERVTLDGTASEDTDGVIVSYLWQQTKGKTVSLSDPEMAALEFLAPDVDSATYTEELIFKLTVTDDCGAVAEDECIINVSFINESPVARLNCPTEPVNAGDTVTLDGLESSDPDNGIAGYQWRQTITDGTIPVVFSSTKTAETSFVAPDAISDDAHLSFELTVSDYDGGKATESCTITVKGLGDTDSDNDGLFDYIENQYCTDTDNPDSDGDGMDDGMEDANQNGVVDDGEYDPCVFNNIAPYAHAGDNQIVFMQTEVTLNGSNSWDINDNIVSYSWQQTSGPQVQLVGADTENPTFTTSWASRRGNSLAFELTVTDAEGLIAKDSCRVIVIQTPEVFQSHIDKTDDLLEKVNSLRTIKQQLLKKLVYLREYRSEHPVLWQLKGLAKKLYRVKRAYNKKRSWFINTKERYKTHLETSKIYEQKLNSL